MQSNKSEPVPHQWKVSSAMKKKRGGADEIQYKFCEGTGTEIKYVLKLGYFI